MGNESAGKTSEEEFILTVDDNGRVTLPQAIRDQLGIESNDEIPARLVGSVLEMNLEPSPELQTATAGRDSWENTTPADAGDALFRPIDE